MKKRLKPKFKLGDIVRIKGLPEYGSGPITEVPRDIHDVYVMNLSEGGPNVRKYEDWIELDEDGLDKILKKL